MKSDILVPIAPLFPCDFFVVGCSIPYVKKPFEKLALLPDTSELLAEESFAKVYLGWNERGLFVELYVMQPFQGSAYPDYASGDSFELFIDTRDVKSAGFATQFCHHFVLLPQALQGIQAQEVSHFRSEDSHPLCDPQLIEVSAEPEKKSYSLRAHFPQQTLHGFDPNVCHRLGFTYKVNRTQGDPMHFSVSSDHITIAQQPGFWASLYMEEK